MRRLAAGLLVVLAALTAAAEPQDALKELEGKVAKSLARATFSDPSRRFVMALWEEYRQAFVSNKRPQAYRGQADVRPDVASYDDYLGRYAAKGRSSKQPAVEVITDGARRLVVKLEGHTIPAVAWNKCILFTTGDVVYSRTPALGAKPHATLEYYVLRRVKGRYSLSSPDAPASQALPLEKTSGR